MISILALTLFLALCAQTNGQSSCANVLPSNRFDCGHPGIMQKGCFDRGCCYDDSVASGVPWCFFGSSAQSNTPAPAVNLLPSNLPSNTPRQLTCNYGNPNRRVDCGQPGITQSQCEENVNCCFDNSVNNVPWCFKAETDQERSLEPSGGLTGNSLPFQAVSSNLFITANIQYSGTCLFHCSSIPAAKRLQCEERGISEANCTRLGCCFNRNAGRSDPTCYWPADTQRTCPSFQCQIPSGIPQPCICGSNECCRAERDRAEFCYRYEVPSRSQRPITLAPTPPTTPRVLSFIERLRNNNGGSLKGYSIRDILTEPLEELLKRGSDYKEPTTTRSTTTQTTTTTVATTTRYTTPVVTQPPPATRRVCSWGRCRFVPVPTPAQPSCFPQTCGQVLSYPDSTNPTTNNRKIVGGSRAHPHSHPWNVMILKREGSQTFLCGGAIICSHWVVTAAHCLNRQTENRKIPDLDAIFYTIYVGRHIGWNSTTYEDGVQVFSGRRDIDYLEQHEDFVVGVNRGVITDDIALIRLRKPIEFGDTVQPICLPTKAPAENKILWATGWGETKKIGVDNTVLKQVATKILNRTVCDKEVPKFKDNNPHGVLCAGGEFNHDTCTGDSGGPLAGPVEGSYNRAERRRNLNWQLYGLTSLGSPSCNTLYFDRQPALYTDVAHFLPWIKARTQNCCRVYRR